MLLMKTVNKAESIQTSRVSAMLSWTALLLATLLVILSFSVGDASAASQTGRTRINFNHSKTGFALVGAHSKVNCESCHAKGVFKGTPKECSGCHAQGVRVLATSKPSNHVASNDKCEACHKATGWLPAIFNHDQVASGSCATCHNNSKQAGKPPKHLQTAKSCDLCHQTTAWLPAKGFEHTVENMQGKTCAQCHDGHTATGKASSHIPTSDACDTCHSKSIGVTFKGAKFNHSGITAGCARCHNNSTAVGIVKGHIPTTASCETCHKNTTTFTSTPMNHGGITKDCASCHGGGFANVMQKPSGHIQTSASCETCHKNTSSFKGGAAMNHSGITSKCVSCHYNGNSQGAVYMPAGTGHIPTGSAVCENCHTNTTSFKTVTMNHGSVAGTSCATCHGGNFKGLGVVGKSSSHILTSAACESCHTSTTSFKTGAMNHSGITGNCVSCHYNGNSQGAVYMPAGTGHIPTGSAVCENCHTNTTSFKTVTMNHGSVAGTSCSTCHGGTYKGLGVVGKSSNHIVTSAACESCHTSTTSFKTGAMNHSGITGNCVSCHYNGNSQGAVYKPAGTGHIPTGSAVCENCHTNTTSFKTVTMNHGSVAGTSCSTCHGGTYKGLGVVGKSSNHIVTSAACESCHTSTTSFKTGAMNHSGITGNCVSCHYNGNSQGAVYKPAGTGHIPTGSAVCENCHTNTTSFKTVKMNHTAVVGTACSNCHNSTYKGFGAKDKPSTHVSTQAACDSCHKNTTSFLGATYNHPIVTSGCATCHYSGNPNNAVFKPAGTGHIPTTAACESCHTNTSSFKTVTMNHTAVVGTACSNCHNSTYKGFGALDKPSTHVSTQAACDSCHKNTTSFLGAAYNHPVVTSGCVTCHVLGNSYNAVYKPAGTGHIPTTAACENCHTNTSSFKTVTMNHTAVVGTACSNCHNSTYKGFGALDKPSTHVSTQAACDSCHKNTTSFLGAAYNHPVVTSGCATCHYSGNPNNAVFKPAGTGHIPTTAACENCHTNTSSFKTVKMNHTAVIGTACSNCHNSTYKGFGALDKPSTHVSTQDACDSCHKNTTSFLGATYNHPIVTSGCVTCHVLGNSYNAVYKPAGTGHIPTTAACENCHTNTSSFKTVKMNHTAVIGTACSNCHNSTYKGFGALDKPSTHVSTQAACDSCHKNTTSFLGATYNHPVVTSGCVTCHVQGNSYNAVYKPAGTGHIPTTAACENCHTNTSSFKTVKMNHTAVVGTGCSTCHGGTYKALGVMDTTAVGLHVPVNGVQCDTCHSSTSAFSSTKKPSHSLLSTDCKICHALTRYPNVKYKNHNLTKVCTSCHNTNKFD